MAFGLFLILLVEQLALSCDQQTVDYEPLPGNNKPKDDRIDRDLRTGLDSSTLSSERLLYSRALNANDDDVISNISDTYSIVDAPDEHAPHQDPRSHSVVRSLMLLLSLSLHSVFEGLALGLQSSMSSTLQIFAALAVHKSVLAFRY